MKSLPKICCLLGLFSMVFFGCFTKAQENNQETQDALAQQLKELEEQISEGVAQVKEIQTQKNTLANKLKALKKEQNVLELKMKTTDIHIQKVEKNIDQTQQEIEETQAHLVVLRQEISEFIRTMYITDQQPPLYAFLKGGDILEAFDHVQQLSQLTADLNAVVNQAKDLKDTLVQKQGQLVDEKGESQALQEINKKQKETIKEKAQTQNTLLAETKGKEEIYQEQLNNKKAQANAIKQRMYQLLGIDTKQMTFGEAVKMAEFASKTTGIEPAFLLSVLSQESELGTNVGTCNRPGDPETKHWKVVMKPDRDHEPFLTILKDLNRSPEGMPVSCPMKDKKGKQIGWGGAMGPAQFIPSTWVAYAPRVTQITGGPADPWNIGDAFLAAAIKLTSDGADHTENGQWTAAMKYFSGGTNKKFRFYGDEVLERAAQYRKDIETLGS